MAPLRSFHSLRRYVGSGEGWRKAVWNRWLVSYLTPPEDEAAPDAAEGVARPDGASEEAAPSSSERGSGAVSQRKSEAPPPEPPSQAWETGAVEHRQMAARARLSSISQQMFSVETALDSLSDRLSVRELNERRANQRMLELIERVAETADRQSEALERTLATLDRVERRLAQVDRWVRPSDVETIPPPPNPSSVIGLGALRRRASVQGSGPVRQTPSTSGSLGDMSLATVLSMLELERRTGFLTIDGDQERVRFDLLNGSVAGGFVNDQPEDPLEVLRMALGWRTGTFSFYNGQVVPSGYPTRSVGALLLEASQQNDEAIREIG